MARYLIASDGVEYWVAKVTKSRLVLSKDRKMIPYTECESVEEILDLNTYEGTVVEFLNGRLVPWEPKDKGNDE